MPRMLLASCLSRHGGDASAGSSVSEAAIALAATASIAVDGRVVELFSVRHTSEPAAVVGRQHSLAVPRNHVAHAGGGAGLWSWHWPVLLVVGAFCAAGVAQSTTRRDNAHNNFAQIAGELGLVGLIESSSWFWLSRSGAAARNARHVVAMPVIARPRGVHPDVAGRPSAARRGGRPIRSGSRLASRLRSCASIPERTCRPAIVGLAVALLLVSIPFRVGAKSAQLDLAERHLRRVRETAHDVARAILRARAASRESNSLSALAVPAMTSPLKSMCSSMAQRRRPSRSPIGTGGRHPSTSRAIRLAAFTRSICASGRDTLDNRRP